MAAGCPSLADGLFITAGLNCPLRTLKCHRAVLCAQHKHLYCERCDSSRSPAGSTSIDPAADCLRGYIIKQAILLGFFYLFLSVTNMKVHSLIEGKCLLFYR